jgi:hypothetical protein
LQKCKKPDEVPQTGQNASALFSKENAGKSNLGAAA